MSEFYSGYFSKTNREQLEIHFYIWLQKERCLIAVYVDDIVLATRDIKRMVKG